MLAIFVLFSYWEGYLAISNISVWIIYVVMAIIGLLYSLKHSIEWNTLLLVVSVAVGGYMELLGSMTGYWTYSFHETLAIFFVLSWALNTMGVHGLAYVLCLDLGDVEKRHHLPRNKAHKEPVGKIFYLNFHRNELYIRNKEQRDLVGNVFTRNR